MATPGFIVLYVVMFFIVLAGWNAVLKKQLLDKSERQKKILTFVIPVLLWTLYMYILSYTGVLKDFSLPPRFPLLLILPLFLFTGFFLYKHRNSELLHAIPKSWPVYIQSFRIVVESLFVMAVAENILPYQVTFEGFNMDLIFAATAPIVAFLAFQKQIISERVVLIWNYLGLAVIASIIFLFTTTFFFPSVWGSDVSLADEQIGEFGNMLVPGFLMPMAVFMHILSIIQLKD